MARPETGRQDGADDDAAIVERELMILDRMLEALQRKRRYPLDRAAFLILRTLSDGGSATVGGLARTLLVDDSTMTRQVAALEERGMVSRTPNPADRRAGVIAVTPKGEAQMRDMLMLRRQRVGFYLADWQADEREAFGQLLGRFNAKLVAALGE